MFFDKLAILQEDTPDTAEVENYPILYFSAY